MFQITEDNWGDRIGETQYLDNNANILAPILWKKVDFLHLSVREYLESTEPIIACNTWEEGEALMAASVRLLKLVPPTQLFKDWGQQFAHNLYFPPDIELKFHSDASFKYADGGYPQPLPPSIWSPVAEYTRHNLPEDLMNTGYWPIERFF